MACNWLEYQQIIKAWPYLLIKRFLVAQDFCYFLDFTGHLMLLSPRLFKIAVIFSPKKLKKTWNIWSFKWNISELWNSTSWESVTWSNCIFPVCNHSAVNQSNCWLKTSLNITLAKRQNAVLGMFWMLLRVPGFCSAWISIYRRWRIVSSVISRPSLPVLEVIQYGKRILVNLIDFGAIQYPYIFPKNPSVS